MVVHGGLPGAIKHSLPCKADGIVLHPIGVLHHLQQAGAQMECTGGTGQAKEKCIRSAGWLPDQGSRGGARDGRMGEGWV